MAQRAYLDHAATSPMSDAVLAEYVRALGELGNPASTHGHGQAALERLEAARERVARGIGCDTAELVFTGGGTESINLALKGAYWARQRDRERPVLLVSEGEHHATIEAAEWLRDAQGAELVWLPLDSSGTLLPDVLAAAIAAAGAHRVALVSFLWANNEVGTVQPVAELTAIAEAAGIPAHVDAVAALGQTPVDFAASGASLLSVSGHKVGAPVGVGALAVRRDTTVEPLFHGGSQQRGRSGTQDVAGAVAFAAALDEVLVPSDGDGGAGGAVGAAGVGAAGAAGTAPHPEHLAHLARLRDRLVAGVRAAVPDAVLRGADPALAPAPAARASRAQTSAPDSSLSSDEATDARAGTVPARLPGNAHFTFPGCQGDSLVFLLDAAGVSVSVGSACRAGVAETSHVLLSMGISEEEAAGALRFTLGAASTDEDIDALLAALPDAVARARLAGLS